MYVLGENRKWGKKGRALLRLNQTVGRNVFKTDDKRKKLILGSNLAFSSIFRHTNLNA